MAFPILHSNAVDDDIHANSSPESNATVAPASFVSGTGILMSPTAFAAAPVAATAHSTTAIGLFSVDDERAEIAAMDATELQSSAADLYGTHMDERIRELSVLADGDPAFLSSALSELDMELGRVPPGRRKSYDLALRLCPREVMSSDVRVAFLWREEFDARLAARRITLYWERRRELFGEDKWTRPMTMAMGVGAMGSVGDVAALAGGTHRLLPIRDAAGRAIFLVTPKNRNMSLPRESMVRVVWYLLHVAMEDPEIQRRGFVYVIDLSDNLGAQFSQFEPKLFSKILDLERLYLPIHLRAVHLCQPPPFFRAVAPIIKFVFGRRIRARLCIHHGSTRKVLEKLNKFGISAEALPLDCGGMAQFDLGRWLCERLEVEESRRLRDCGSHNDSSSNRLDVLATAVLQRQGGEGRVSQSGSAGSGDGYNEAEDVQRSAKKKRESELQGGSEVSGPLHSESGLIAASAVLPASIEQQHPSVRGLSALDSLNTATSLPPNDSVHDMVASTASDSLLNRALVQLVQNQTSSTAQADLAATRVETEVGAPANGLAALVSPELLLLAQGGLVGGQRSTTAPAAAANLPDLQFINGSAGGKALAELYGRHADAISAGVALNPTSPVAASATPQLQNALNSLSHHANRQNTAGLATTTAPMLQTALNALSRQLHADNAPNGLEQVSVKGSGSNALPNVQRNAHSMAAAAGALRPILQQQLIAGSTSPESTLDQQSLQFLPGHSLSSPPTCSTTPPPTNSLYLPRALFVPMDEVKVSAYQCLVRKQAEAFVATEEHVQHHARGRCHPVILGQVGIRCRHCKGHPLKSSPRGSIYFPSELVGMYQTAQKMATLHLASSKTQCTSMAPEVREEFQQLVGLKSMVGGGKHYWAEAGRMIGLVDSPDGIRFNG